LLIVKHGGEFPSHPAPNLRYHPVSVPEVTVLQDGTMCFLDKPTDMSGTVFKTVNAENTKAFLVSAFDKCRPGWTTSPVGEVGRMWKGDSEPEHRRLVVLGLILDRLQHTITQSPPLTTGSGRPTGTSSSR
jgi:hypothetical protein